MSARAEWASWMEIMERQRQSYIQMARIATKANRLEMAAGLLCVAEDISRLIDLAKKELMVN